MNEMSRDLPTQERKLNIEPGKDFDIVLAFAGGGTSGAGSLEIIKVIDEKLSDRGFPPGTFLDLINRPETVIAGTSTGAIIASLVKTNDRINPETNKKYTIDDYEDMYRDISPKLFFPWPRVLRCCCIAPFVRDSLDEASLKYFGNQTINESPGLVVVAFNKTTGLSEAISLEGMHGEYTIGDSAEASAAIPCMFAPMIINGNSYSDGGTCLASMHPTIEAYTHYKKLRKMYASERKFADNVVIIDIGAGEYSYKYSKCIGPDNKGGCIASLLDGTICECSENLQQTGPEIVESMAKEETYNLDVFKFNFPAQYPLSFLTSCLDHTIHVAREETERNPELVPLVDLLHMKLSSGSGNEG